MKLCHLVVVIAAAAVMTTVSAYGQTPATRGLAQRYSLDQGIDRDPNVFVFADFETDAWREIFAGVSSPTVSIAAEGSGFKFQPFRGKAMRIKVENNGHYGASLVYSFKRNTGSEPGEVYFRYYLRFADDWDPKQGGKLPGIGGTYARAGWGGRPSNGRNGWSARGQFNGRGDNATPIGYYCYHADMKGIYGSQWIWEKDKLGYLENNRWYCIEQYVKMNTPGANDGILRGWVDGRLAFEKTDVRMRDIPELRIECVWINIYHGGTWTATSDDHLFIDNVVVAKEYIGPMSMNANSPTLPQDPNGNFILYVANQSFDEDPVDITVRIDDAKAVDSDFYVGNQHNWVKHQFALAPGRHKLNALSKKGKTALETEFEITDKHWAVIDYWYYPKLTGGAGPTPRHFSFLIQDTPIGFE
ncbi:MAG: hypothetical protein JW720_09760 [Sedimentisphaerales bacterium]|nr:hypothetical protein [Sedimentisphaerales bacterium]